MAARFVLLSAVALICVASLVQESSASCLRHTYKNKCYGKYEVPHYKEPCTCDVEEESYEEPEQEFHVYSGRPDQPTTCESHYVNVEAPPSRQEEPCVALGYGLQVPVKKSYRQKCSSHGYDVEVPKKDEQIRCNAYGVYVDTPPAPEAPKCSSHYYQVESLPQKHERRNAYGIAVAVPKKRVEHVRPMTFNYHVETPKEKEEEERYAYGIAVQKFETQPCDPCEDVYEAPIEQLPPPPPPCKPCVDNYVFPPQHMSVRVKGSSCSCGKCSSCTAGGYSYDYSGEAAGESSEECDHSHHSHTRYGHGSKKHKEHYGGSRKYSASGDYSSVSTDGCVRHQSVIVPRFDQVEHSYDSGDKGDYPHVPNDGCVHHKSVIVPRLEKGYDSGDSGDYSHVPNDGCVHHKSVIVPRLEKGYDSGDSGDYSHVPNDGCVHHKSVIVPRLENVEPYYKSGAASSYYSNDKYEKMSEADAESQIESPLDISYSKEPHYSKCIYHTLFPSTECSRCRHRGISPKGVYVSDLDYYSLGNSYDDDQQDVTYEETEKYAGGLAHECCCCCCASKTVDYGKKDYDKKDYHVGSQKIDESYSKGYVQEEAKTYEGGSYEGKEVVVEEKDKDAGGYSGDKEKVVVVEEVKESGGYSGEKKDYGIGYSGGKKDYGVEYSEGKDYGATEEKVLVEETITKNEKQYEAIPKETVTVTKYTKSSEVADNYPEEKEKVVIEKETEVKKEEGEQKEGYDAEDEIKEVTVTTTTVTKKIGGRSKESTYYPEAKVTVVKKISSGEYGPEEGGNEYNKKVVVTKTIVDGGYGGKSREYSSPEKDETKYESDTYEKNTSTEYKSKVIERPQYAKETYDEKQEGEYGNVVKKISSREYGGNEGEDGYVKKVVVTKTVVNEGYGGKSKEYTIPEKEEAEYESNVHKKYKTSEYITKGPHYAKETYREKPEESYEKVIKKISGKEYGGDEEREGYSKKVVVTKTVVNEGRRHSKEYTVPEKTETVYESPSEIYKKYKSSEYKSRETEYPRNIKKSYKEKPGKEYDNKVRYSAESYQGKYRSSENDGKSYETPYVVTNGKPMNIRKAIAEEIYYSPRQYEMYAPKKDDPSYLPKYSSAEDTATVSVAKYIPCISVATVVGVGGSTEPANVVCQTDAYDRNVECVEYKSGEAKHHQKYDGNSQAYKSFVGSSRKEQLKKILLEDPDDEVVEYRPGHRIYSGEKERVVDKITKVDYDKNGGSDYEYSNKGKIAASRYENNYGENAQYVDQKYVPTFHVQKKGSGEIYPEGYGGGRKYEKKVTIIKKGYSGEKRDGYDNGEQDGGYNQDYEKKVTYSGEKIKYEGRGSGERKYGGSGERKYGGSGERKYGGDGYIKTTHVTKKGYSDDYPSGGYKEEDGTSKYEKKVTVIEKKYSGERVDGDYDRPSYVKKGSHETYKNFGYAEEDKDKYEKTVTKEKIYSGERKDDYQKDGYDNGEEDYKTKTNQHGGYSDGKQEYEKKITVIKKTYSGEKTDYPEDDGKNPGSQYGYEKKGSSERISYGGDDKEKYEKKVTVIEKSYSGEKKDYSEDDGKYPSRQYGYDKKGSSERISYGGDDKEKYEKKVTVIEKSYSGEKKDYSEDDGKYPSRQYGYDKKGSSERIGYGEDDKEKYEKKVTVIEKSYSGEKKDYSEDDGKYPSRQYGYDKKGSSERIGYGEDDKEKYEKKVTVIEKSYSGEKKDYAEDDGKYSGGQYGYEKKGSSERFDYGEGDKEKYEKKVTVIKKSYSGEKKDYPEDEGKYPDGQYGYEKKGSSERIGYGEDDKEKYEKKVTIIKNSYSGEKKDYPEDDGQYGYQKKGSSERFGYGQDDQEKYEKKVTVTKKSYSGEVNYGNDGYANVRPSGYKRGSGESYQISGYGGDEKDKNYGSSTIFRQQSENKKNIPVGGYDMYAGESTYRDGKQYHEKMGGKENNAEFNSYGGSGYQKGSHAHYVPQKGYGAASVKKGSYADEQSSSGGFYSAAGEKYSNKGRYYGGVKAEGVQKYAGVDVDYGTGYSAGNKVRKISQGYEDGVVYSAGGSSYGVSHRRANANAKASAVYVDYAEGSGVDAYGQSQAQRMGKARAYQATTGYSEGSGGEFSYGYRASAKNGGKVYRKANSPY